jgi:hypothetical protein
MPLHLANLLEARRADSVVLYEYDLNAQLVRILRMLGCPTDYVRAEGPYLFDAFRHVQVGL